MAHELLEDQCKRLKLPTIPLTYQGIDFHDKCQYLTDVLARELESRKTNKVKRILKKAGFPNIKTLQGYLFDHISLPTTLTEEQLKQLSFLERKENLIMLGPVGTGKTHLATALAVKACNKGFRARFFRVVELVNSLLEKHKANTLGYFLRELKRCELLILDELGFVPFHKDGAELLFNIISDCYESKSLIVTSNLEFGQWNTVFGDNRLTAAFIDRLVHHAHILAFTGESFRLRHARLAINQ